MMTAVFIRALAQPIAVAPQSALEPAGPAADSIHTLWQVMLWSGGIITVLVLLMLAWAIWRPRRAGEVPEADRAADSRGEGLNDESGGRGHEEEGRPWTERVGVRVMVGGGVILPIVSLGLLLVFVMRTLDATSMPSHVVRASSSPPAAGVPTIVVRGHQYWWQVTYLDENPAGRFETANELVIPVGQRVVLRLEAGDVIHSFWVPGLQGKMDLVPGRTNVLFLEADRAGEWRGQCAEFCGVQHALMALTVIALPAPAWQQWMTAQREVARVPADSTRLADQTAFLGSGCVLCHSVRGTTARGSMGPDLTHFASRRTIAAGTLPNSAGHRFGWVADPQAIKPGNRMPTVPMRTDELHAIVRYLGTLQ